MTHEYGHKDIHDSIILSTVLSSGLFPTMTFRELNILPHSFYVSQVDRWMLDRLFFVRFGVISMCIGFGMEAAAALERGDSMDELCNIARTCSCKIL